MAESFSLIHNQSKGLNILLFHGLTATPDEMKDLAEFLHEKGHSTYVPLLSGHGESIEILRKTPAKVWLNDCESEFEKLIKEDGEVCIIGQSFGALLSLYLAAKYKEQAKLLVLLSVPLKFKSNFKNFFFSIVSNLPDAILNLLGLVNKKQRSKDDFLLPRVSFHKHSIAAATRLVQIRKQVIKSLKNINCPILVLQDPEDHHISRDVYAIVKEGVSSTVVEYQEFENGQHELTLGSCYREVRERIFDFINKQ